MLRQSDIAFALFTPVALILAGVFVAQAAKTLIAQGALLGRRAVVIGESAEMAGLTASNLLISYGLTELFRIVIGNDCDGEGLSSG